MDRRKFVKLSSSGLASVALENGAIAAPAKRKPSPDVVVIGAGVFGVWAALHLRRKGAAVTLVDTYGPGNEFSSSGGHTRLTQVDSDSPVYIRSCVESFSSWQEMDRASYARIIFTTGRLRMSTRAADLEVARRRKENLVRFGVTNAEILDAAEMRRRWPAIFADDMLFGMYYPDGPAGSALRAELGVKVVANEFEKSGGRIVIGSAEPVLSDRRVREIRIKQSGERIRAQSYVFACGPWMPSLFPELLADRLRVEPRIVFFYNLPAGDTSLAFPNLPAWTIPEVSVYGVPSIENEGFKVAPGFQPGSVPDIEQQMREFASRRFPKIAGMPVLRSRACQFMRSITEDFIIDRHPGLANGVLMTGDSGLGYKHGPVVGEHASRLVLGEALDPEYASAFRLRNERFPS